MSIFVISLCLAVVAAIIPFLVPGKETRERIVLALSCFIIPPVIGLGLQFNETQRMIERIEDRVGIVIELPSDEHRVFVESYARNTRQIAKFDNKLLLAESDALENGFRSAHNDLASGKINKDPSQLMLIATRLMDEANRSVMATSLLTSDWRDKWGEQYWQANRDQIADGVTIRRLFLLPPGHSTADVADALRLHIEAGVEVHTLENVIDPRDLRDVIVVDDQLAGEVFFASRTGVVNAPQAITIYVDPQKVKEVGEWMKNLFHKSVRFQTS
jgi:hypothetical protein